MNNSENADIGDAWTSVPKKVVAKWQFTIAASRIKLRKLYPTI